MIDRAYKYNMPTKVSLSRASERPAHAAPFVPHIFVNVTIICETTNYSMHTQLDLINITDRSHSRSIYDHSLNKDSGIYFSPASDKNDPIQPLVNEFNVDQKHHPNNVQEFKQHIERLLMSTEESNRTRDTLNRFEDAKRKLVSSRSEYFKKRPIFLDTPQESRRGKGKLFTTESINLESTSPCRSQWSSSRKRQLSKPTFPPIDFFFDEHIMDSFDLFSIDLENDDEAPRLQESLAEEKDAIGYILQQ